MLLGALLAGWSGFNHVRARRATRRADEAEARAKAVEAQAEAMARIELARERARQSGQNELAKMRAALGAGRRDQLEKK